MIPTVRVHVLLLLFAVAAALSSLGACAAQAIAERAGASRVAEEYSTPMAATVEDSPSAHPAPSPELLERLVRTGKLASALQLVLHLALNLALARWSWLVGAAPWLGRWKWAAIASATATAVSVTLPAALSGVQTWEMLLWPLACAVGQAMLPSRDPGGPARIAT